MTGVPQLPPSYSNIGRTADASRKSTTKVHVHKKKIVLQPWDGLELVDQILAEAKGNSANPHNPREDLRLSSPRVNPLLSDKSLVETSSEAVAKFLKATAASIADLPARQGDSGDESVDPYGNSTHITKGKGRAKKAKSSACFLSSQRPALATATAPPVGKYTPKFGFVERRSATPVLSKVHRSRGHRHIASTSCVSTAQDESANPATLNSEDHSAMANAKPGTPATDVNPDRSESPTYHKHNVRDCSSAFKSKTGRSQDRSFNDLSYWPLPFDGDTTYSRGAMIGLGRERAYTPFGVPQGAKVDYKTDVNRRPHSSLDISKLPGREETRTRQMFPPEDTTQLAYNPQVTALSTMPTSSGYYTMSRQSSRPETRAASPGDSLDPYHNSMLTTKKKGFVDIKRMVYNAAIYADDDIPPPQQLNVDHSIVETTAPRPVFSKAARSPTFGTATVDVSYVVDDASIRRKRPQCFMPKTNRSTFVAKPVRTHDDLYDVKELTHISVVEFGKQISRDVRDKRFEFK